MSASTELFTPRSVIAGRLAGHTGRSPGSALRAAAAVLGTEQVAMICRAEKDVLWFLAAPAGDLASHMQSASALAVALPTAEGHQGDAAYIAELDGGLQAVVVRQGERFQSYVGTPPMVQRFIAMEGASVTHTCNGPGMPWTFPAAPAHGRAGRIHAGLTLAGLLLGSVAACVWLWAGAQVSAFHQDAEDWHMAQRAAIQSGLQSLSVSAYPAPVIHLQKAVDEAAREGGYLLQFQHKEGQSSWSINVNGRVVEGGAK